MSILLATLSAFALFLTYVASVVAVEILATITAFLPWPRGLFGRALFSLKKKATDDSAHPAMPTTNVVPSQAPDTHEHSETRRESKATRQSRVFRYLRLTLLSAAVLLILLSLAIQFLFLDSSVRKSIGFALRHSDIRLTAGRITGNLFTGRIDLRDIALSRATGGPSELDIRAVRVIVDINIPRLFIGMVAFDDLSIEDLHGDFRRLRAPVAPLVSRKFKINNLQINDASINIKDESLGPNPIEAKLVVNQLHSSPFRSEWALYDLLFSSNISGAVDDHDFRISSSKVGSAQLIHWSLRSFPIELVRPYIGGPLSGLASGELDFEVQGRRDLASNTIGNFDCSMTIRRLSATPSGALDLLDEFSRSVFARLWQAGHDELITDFTITIDPQKFRGNYTFEDAGLWDVVRSSLAAELRRIAGLPSAELQKAGQKTLQQIKDSVDQK